MVYHPMLIKDMSHDTLEMEGSIYSNENLEQTSDMIIFYYKSSTV